MGCGFPLQINEESEGVDTSARRKIAILTMPVFELLPLTMDSGMRLCPAGRHDCMYLPIPAEFDIHTGRYFIMVPFGPSLLTRTHSLSCSCAGAVVEEQKWFDLSPKGRILFKIR